VLETNNFSCLCAANGVPITDDAIRAEFDVPSLPVRTLVDRLYAKGYVLQKQSFLDAVRRVCDCNQQERTLSLKQ
jgi:hypothetical protein